MIAKLLLPFLLLLERLGKEVDIGAAFAEIGEYLLSDIEEQLVTHLFSLQLI